MNALDLAAALVCLAAAFGVVNHFLLKLPSAIGMVIIALATSLTLMLIDLLVPGFGIDDMARRAVLGIDFSEALLRGMLGFLLFAGALHVDHRNLPQTAAVRRLAAAFGIEDRVVELGVGPAAVDAGRHHLDLELGAIGLALIGLESTHRPRVAQQVGRFSAVVSRQSLLGARFSALASRRSLLGARFSASSSKHDLTKHDLTKRTWTFKLQPEVRR